MAVSPTIKRIDKYDAKYSPEAYKIQLDDIKVFAQADYAGKINSWVMARDQVVTVVGAAGESRLFLGSYLAFGGQVWKLTQWLAGESLKTEVANLIALWTARGLVGTTLAAIRDEVFGVAEPPVA